MGNKKFENWLKSYVQRLTLWDKMSQNLVHLEAISHKIFQISQNFQTILQHILWRNNINDTLLCLSQAAYS